MVKTGDCLEILKGMDSNSVDALVTDPPAGISFMGKEWDSNKGGREQWIAWMRDVMQECLRVLKPGAHAFVWAIPRTSHWTATALEDSGFEIRDVVTHLFGSGFPKSLDISKAIDKAAGAEREVIGRNPTITSSKGFGQNQRDDNWTPPDVNSDDPRLMLTAPATDAAKQWQGWGTALKPASEHWILCRKPISEKTVAANVLKHGTGGLNIDSSRINVNANDPNRQKSTGGYKRIDSQATVPNAPYNKTRDATLTQGRFPANLILSHNDDCVNVECSEGCAVAALDEQSGVSKSSSKARNNKPSENVAMSGPNTGHVSFGHDDSGCVSGFFYCAKASKRERNEGCEGLPEKAIIAPSANHHPCVKPIKLMSYLITMITPPNGTVIDPFCGSGSTGVAAIQSGFNFIGIEQNHEYVEIAEKRINHTKVVEK